MFYRRGKSGFQGDCAAIRAIEATDASHSIDAEFRIRQVAAGPAAGLAIDAIRLAKTEKKHGNRVEQAVNRPQGAKDAAPRPPRKERGGQNRGDDGDFCRGRPGDFAGDGQWQPGLQSPGGTH